MKKKFCLTLVLILLFSAGSFASYRSIGNTRNLFIENPYFAASGGGITQPTTAEEITVVSTAAADNTGVYVFGEKDGTVTEEVLTLNGTTTVDGTYLFSNIYSIRKASTTGRVIVKTLETTPETLATIPLTTLYCYNAGTLNSTTGNFPTGVVVTTTGWGNTHNDTFLLADEGYPAINVRCSNITEPISWKYQISDDETNWIDGELVLINLDNNQSREACVEPYIRFLRFVLTHTTNTVEAKPSVNIIVTNK